MMVHLIWSLILTAILLCGAVIIPIWMDRPWEYEGVTERWADQLAAWNKAGRS